MKEELTQLKNEIIQLKQRLNELDFAVKNHKHKDLDFSKKL